MSDHGTSRRGHGMVTIPDNRGSRRSYGTQQSDVWQRAVERQFAYSTIGLILGLVCIVGGIVLFLHGVTGNSSWILRILGAESRLTDAAPGVILFVVGLFVVFITRYEVRAK